MIGEAYAKQQVLRLSGLDFYPNGPALRELVNAMQLAQSENVARSAIDSFMAEMTTCPKPAEVRRVLFDLSTDKEWAPAEENASAYCQHCNGTGWVHETRLIHAPHYGPQGRKNEYAGRCSCRIARATEVVPTRGNR